LIDGELDCFGLGLLGGLLVGSAHLLQLDCHFVHLPGEFVVTLLAVSRHWREKDP
jgi:hypothetical protein